MISWEDYIESNPSVLFGKPVVKSTRIPVDLILEKLANGDTFKELIAAYPALNAEKINACLFFAADAVRNETMVNR